MTGAAASGFPRAERGRSRTAVVAALGVCQILAWGSSYYLIAVTAAPVVADTGWPLAWVVGGLSLGLFVSGAISPAVGRTIERRGGRPVLMGSAILLAAGLAALGAAQGIATWLAAWIVIGLGMGAGLYDPAFAALGRRYGTEARGAISTLTLWGGFASTVCWPLSALLVDSVGWRGACFAYAAIHVAVVLPLYAVALPREAARAAPPASAPPAPGVPPAAPASRRTAVLFALLAAAITLSAVITTVVAVHLITLLQARGLALGAAVALGALVGPSQVGSRIVDRLASRHYHPIWTLVGSAVLTAAGLAILFFGPAAIAVGLVCYGAGAGLRSIARGTLPLVLFGAAGYAVLMGRLAMPSLIAQALSPSIGGILMDGYGAGGTLLALVAAAVVNVLIVAVLWACARRPPAVAAAAPGAAP